MSDLISRETVISTIHNYFKSLIDKTIFDIDVVDCAKGVSEAIDSIPTAYDVDGVAEELKRMSGIQFDGHNESYELNWCISTDRAVEIVKGAVKDE